MYRWVMRGGVMHLQSRKCGSRQTTELGHIAQREIGFVWETEDGRWGGVAPTLQHAMVELEHRARRR